MKIPNPFRRKPIDTADEIIRRYVKGAAALGAAGTIAMHADVIVLAGLWALMIVALAQHHDISLGYRDALKIGTALATASATFALGFYTATAYFALSVVGIPVVMTANVIMDAILTCAVGVAVSMVFASGDKGSGWLAMILTAFGAILAKLGPAFLDAWWKGGASVDALKKLLGWKPGEIPHLSAQ